MSKDTTGNRSTSDAGPLLFVNASQVVTCAGPGRARRGSEMSDIAIRTDVGVAIDDGRIVAVDAPSTLSERFPRSEEHTSELQSLRHLVCRLLLEKKK